MPHRRKIVICLAAILLLSAFLPVPALANAGEYVADVEIQGLTSGVVYDPMPLTVDGFISSNAGPSVPANDWLLFTIRVLDEGTPVVNTFVGLYICLNECDRVVSLWGRTNSSGSVSFIAPPARVGWASYSATLSGPRLPQSGFTFPVIGEVEPDPREVRVHSPGEWTKLRVAPTFPNQIYLEWRADFSPDRSMNFSFEPDATPTELGFVDVEGVFRGLAVGSTVLGGKSTRGEMHFSSFLIDVGAADARGLQVDGAHGERGYTLQGATDGVTNLTFTIASHGADEARPNTGLTLFMMEHDPNLVEILESGTLTVAPLDPGDSVLLTVAGQGPVGFGSVTTRLSVPDDGHGTVIGFAEAHPITGSTFRLDSPQAIEETYGAPGQDRRLVRSGHCAGDWMLQGTTDGNGFSPNVLGTTNGRGFLPTVLIAYASGLTLSSRAQNISTFTTQCPMS